ncbi:hypothetical protein MHY01S_18530 [Meiothermus hypogaeus NBRC 106114]|uniref:Uncharacterized protein n=1 Tax=Meiothermus hypogaeus NBRC 106114 TaxID=1227553 RepID=A0A511R2Z2_9DEIN|nr:hypothetical protein MHY01S_18530 [Meiothermus hypogaeus NBRC 106114]
MESDHCHVLHRLEVAPLQEVLVGGLEGAPHLVGSLVDYLAGGGLLHKVHLKAGQERGVFRGEVLGAQ